MTKIRDYIESEDLRYLFEVEIGALERMEQVGYIEQPAIEHLARQWNEDFKSEAEAKDRNSDVMTITADVEVMEYNTKEEIQVEIDRFTLALAQKDKWDAMSEEERDAACDAAFRNEQKALWKAKDEEADADAAAE